MKIATTREISVREVKHRDKWVTADVVDVKFDNGREIKNFLRLTSDGYVSVSARLAGAGNPFLLTRQCKPVAGLTLESVAGGREKGETWMKAACREMIEETGFEPGWIAPVGKYFFPLSDRVNNPCHLFLAFDCRPSKKKLAGDEVQGVQTYCAGQMRVLEMVRNGEIKDLATVAGIFAHLSSGIFIRRRWRC